MFFKLCQCVIKIPKNGGGGGNIDDNYDDDNDDDDVDDDDDDDDDVDDDYDDDDDDDDDDVDDEVIHLVWCRHGHPSPVNAHPAHGSLNHSILQYHHRSYHRHHCN